MQDASAAFQLLLRPAWAALEHELAQAVQQAIQGYWHRWRHQLHHEDMFSPEIQVHFYCSMRRCAFAYSADIGMLLSLLQLLLWCVIVSSF